MTLTIDLTPSEEARLSEAARQEGIDPVELARKLVIENLPRVRDGTGEEENENAASIALLQSWLEEDATNDPEEVRKAQVELDEFKQAINAERDRAGARRVYP